MKKIVILNWKMEPQSEEEARRLFADTAVLLGRAECELYVAPPFIYLEKLEKMLRTLPREVHLCAQDISNKSGGAFTGEVSPEMLRDASVEAVLVGHSERRIHAKETDAVVAEKTCLAANNGIMPVVCVGEPYEVEVKGEEEVRAYIRDQVSSALSLVGETGESYSLAVAYEPVWAISSAYVKAADPVVTQRTGEWIKKKLLPGFLGPHVRILYGGSVAERTVAPYVRSSVFDGFLVGAASLDREFLRTLGGMLR